jgi:[ribosomal protein S5]-alanine N-acetyltransferase
MTRRLLLRPFAPADADSVTILAGVREVAETTARIPHPYPPGAAARWIAGCADAWLAGTGMTYAITDRADARLLGAVGFEVTREGEANLGYWIARDEWNKGICTEAVAALIPLAFTHLRVKTIRAHHLTRNPSSGRVMQKAGMHLDHVALAHHREGRHEEVAFYSIGR